MPTNEYFADRYAHARTKFRSAAQNAGALVHAYEHPSQRGPDGGTLSVDVATVGARDASRCFLLIAALRGDHWLHGAENRQSPLREQITKNLRDAFYVDAPHWQAAVYGRVADFVVRASHVLAET